MASLDDYTSHAAIRSCFGVTDDELPNSVLDLEMYVQYLLADLGDIDADLPADYATVKAIAEGSRSSAQALFYNAVRLLSPYSIAIAVSPAIPLLAQKAITDGKAGLTRFAGEPWRQTLAEVKSMYERLRTRLKDAFLGLDGGATTATLEYFSIASPTSDPVLGT